MKTRLFAIGLIIIFPVTGVILSGCASPAGESFSLEAPGCTATWNDDITWVAWSKVEGADYYEIYGKKYDRAGGESPPRNPKEFTLIATNLTRSPYPHTTRDDYSYVVKAFKNNKDASDFSNVAFTW
jgi:hypothetical protein